MTVAISLRFCCTKQITVSVTEDCCLCFLFVSYITLSWVSKSPSTDSYFTHILTSTILFRCFMTHELKFLDVVTALGITLLPTYWDQYFLLPLFRYLFSFYDLVKSYLVLLSIIPIFN